MQIKGVYEVAIRVRDLSKAEAFYHDVLGLEPALRDQGGKRLFMRAGGSAGMLVLQEDKAEWPAQHFAFTVSPDQIEESASELREKGVSIQGPVLHTWMPARSVYFSDPDGNALELCAPLPEEESS